MFDKIAELAWFKKRITITDEEQFILYLNLKGVKRIRNVYYVIAAHKQQVTSEDIRDLYKYDLRLRRDIYYYLTMYEVYLRAQLSNNFQAKDLKLRQNENLFYYLEHSTFHRLIELYKKIDEKTIDEIFSFSLSKKEFLRRVTAIKKFRNAVFHHNFILDFKSYDRFEIDDLTTDDLVGVLANLIKLLPYSLSETFIKRINRTSSQLLIPKSLIIKF